MPTITETIMPTMPSTSIMPSTTSIPTMTSCPSIEDLWPLAVDESVDPDLESHLNGCPQCAERVDHLMAEITNARSLGDRLRQSLSNDSDANASPKGSLSDDSVSNAPCADDNEHESTPKFIGKYIVLEKLGEGGQATVYRAFNPSLLIDVVIKQAHDCYADDDMARARLVTEAKVLAEVHHPNLPHVYDLGFVEGRPFLIMEYIRGEHLRRRLMTQQFTPVEIARIVAVIARAVSAAHQQGVLHLDLKPENILLTPTGEPILIDFGLAYLLDIDTRIEPTPFCVVGTPEYMSPEQTKRQHGEFSRQTDVHGIGAVLFFLCTGRDPFSTSRVSSEADSREVDWSELKRAGVPKPLANICRRAMADTPDSRFIDADALAHALEGYQQRLLARPQRRRKIASLLIGGIATLMFAAAAVLPTRLDPSSPLLTIGVVRGDREFDLAESLPLLTNDTLRMTTAVETHAHVALIAASADAPPVWCRPLTTHPSLGKTIISFPRNDEPIAYENTEGSMAILFAIRRDHPVRRGDIVAFDGWDRWPTVPASQAVFFSKDGVKVISTDRDIDTRALHVEAERWLNAVRPAIEAHFDDFTGVLLPPIEPHRHKPQ